MGTLLGLLAFLRENYAHEIIRSLLLIATLLIVRVVVGRVLANKVETPVDERRRWSINTRNGLFFIGLAGIGSIWANELQTLAVSMLALLAGVVLATKELIMCLTGGFLRQMADSYGVGDHIEVGTVRGRVVDIGLLATTVLEIGPNHSAHQVTGRALTFPNSLLLSHPVVRENHMGEYVMHIINVPMAYEVPPARAERLLMAAADTACQPHQDAALAHMDAMAKRYLIDVPAVEPRISLQAKDERHYQLILRIAIPAREKQRIEQAILHAFLYSCYPEGASE